MAPVEHPPGINDRRPTLTICTDRMSRQSLETTLHDLNGTDAVQRLIAAIREFADGSG